MQERNNQQQKLQFQKKNIPLPQRDIKCVGQNKISFFCFQRDCQQSALICEYKQCKCLKNKHEQCQFKKAETVLNKIQNKKKTTATQSTIQTVSTIYDNLIEQLSIQKQKTLFKLRNFGLEKNELELIRKFQQEQQLQKINGLLINSVLSQNNIQHQHLLVEDKQTLKFLTKDKNLSQKLQICQGKISKRIFYGLQWKYKLPSSIINTCEQFLTIINFFDSFQNIQIAFKPLYQASKNNFDVKEFHEAVKSIQRNNNQHNFGFSQRGQTKYNTVVIIQTTAGNKILGFHDLPWSRSGDYRRFNENENRFALNGLSGINQLGCKTFIASITNKKKFTIRDVAKVSKTDQNLGPCFGQSDIQIVNNANVNECTFKLKSYSTGIFGQQFKQKDITQFCGAIEGDKIAVKQWEVFQIINDVRSNQLFGGGSLFS